MNGIELLLERLIGAGEAVWRASWQASVLAALVLAVQLVFGRRIAPRWRHAMWVLVLVRLALPVVPSSRLSVFNLAPLRDARPVSAVAMPVAGEPQPLMSTDAFAEEMRARAARFAPRRLAAAPTLTAVYAAAPPPPPPSLWKGWPQALAAAWAAGVLLLATRVAWATWRVSRAMRRLDRVTDDAVLDVLRATAGELRVRRLPALLTGDDLFSPALVGFVRPRLLLPRDLLARFDPAELRLVLLHELAHLKRRDVLVNWFATLLTVLHWPNPVIWLVAWRLRLEARAGDRRTGHVAHDHRRRPPGLRPHHRQAPRDLRPRRVRGKRTAGRTGRRRGHPGRQATNEAEDHHDRRIRPP